MKLYLDMDGVITDFDKQFDYCFGNLKVIDYDTKWKLISVVPYNFYVDMPWMNNGKKLLKYLSYNPIILSSCGSYKIWTEIKKASRLKETFSEPI